jgi:hypothetical protein
MPAAKNLLQFISYPDDFMSYKRPQTNQNQKEDSLFETIYGD